MNEKVFEKATEIISSKMAHCVLALMDSNDYPTASSITVSKNDGIKWVTFCTGLDANKVKRIEKCGRASVCFFSSESWYNITLAGKIEVITDPETKKEMRYDGLEHHFTGAEDKNYCVLKFATERYNLWVDNEDAEGIL